MHCLQAGKQPKRAASNSTKSSGMSSGISVTPRAAAESPFSAKGQQQRQNQGAGNRVLVTGGVAPPREDGVADVQDMGNLVEPCCLLSPLPARYAGA